MENYSGPVNVNISFGNKNSSRKVVVFVPIATMQRELAPPVTRRTNLTRLGLSVGIFLFLEVISRVRL
jgi:hypothetical protein